MVTQMTHGLHMKLDPYDVPIVFLRAHVSKAQQQGVAFSFVQVWLHWVSKAHANGLLFDNRRSIIEVFEPHGYSSWNSAVVHVVKAVFPGWSVTAPGMACPLKVGTSGQSCRC